MTQLQVPFVDFSETTETDMVLADALSPEEFKALKIKALESLGIEVPEGTEEFSDVWGKHIHDINGLEFTKPYHPDIVSVIRNNRAVFKFFWFLS